MPSEILDTPDSAYELISTTRGPTGKLPLTDDLLRHAPSGDLFGWTQNVGMGWNPALLGGKEFTILSTHGGLRAEDGTPIALGFHSGHWEVGIAREGGGGGVRETALRPVRGRGDRSVRRPHPGHDRHVR
jgi:xylonate dehydratase